MSKAFYEMGNVGSVKYTVNYHDGVSTHPDGSEFFGLRCFSNKRKKDQFIRELKADGYSQR